MSAVEGRPYPPTPIPTPTSSILAPVPGLLSPLPSGLCPGIRVGGGEAPSVRFRINVSPQGSRKVEGANLLKGTRAGCIQEGTPKSPGAAHGETKSARGPAARL